MLCKFSVFICHAPLSMDSSGRNIRVGCHFLLQGIFPSQESNLHLLHCRQIHYCWVTREAGQSYANSSKYLKRREQVKLILWGQHSVKFSAVAQTCPTLCDPMNHSTPGPPVHHQLPEFTQTHVHWVGNAIQPSHPLLSPSPPAPNPSQHQSLFQWVNSSHGVAKVLEFQL